MFVLILVDMTDNNRGVEDLADYINVNDDLTEEGFLNVERTKYYEFEDLDEISKQWNFKNPIWFYFIVASFGFLSYDL